MALISPLTAFKIHKKPDVSIRVDLLSVHCKFKHLWLYIKSKSNTPNELGV